MPTATHILSIHCKLCWLVEASVSFYVGITPACWHRHFFGAGVRVSQTAGTVVLQSPIWKRSGCRPFRSEFSLCPKRFGSSFSITFDNICYVRLAHVGSRVGRDLDGRELAPPCGGVWLTRSASLLQLDRPSRTAHCSTLAPSSPLSNAFAHLQLHCATTDTTRCFAFVTSRILLSHHHPRFQGSKTLRQLRAL